MKIMVPEITGPDKQQTKYQIFKLVVCISQASWSLSSLRSCQCQYSQQYNHGISVKIAQLTDNRNFVFQ